MKVKRFNRNQEYEAPVDAVAETSSMQESCVISMKFVSSYNSFNFNRRRTPNTNNIYL